MIQLNKKTIYIIVAVLVVVIVIAGAAAYLLTNNGGNGGTTPTPTPSPTPAPTVVNATTLQFSVNETTSGVPLKYNFAAKNVNTTTEVMRMDILDSAGNYSYIINLGTSTSFLKINDGAWAASDFNTDSAAYIVAFSDYQTALINWNGQDATYSYTTASSSIVISAIHVNPTLEDSLFATS